MLIKNNDLIKKDFNVYIQYNNFHSFLEKNGFDFEILNKNYRFENTKNFEDGNFTKFSDFLEIGKIIKNDISEENKKKISDKKNDIANPNGLINFLFFFRERDFIITDLKKNYGLENNFGSLRNFQTNWIEKKSFLKR